MALFLAYHTIPLPTSFALFPLFFPWFSAERSSGFFKYLPRLRMVMMMKVFIVRRPVNGTTDTRNTLIQVKIVEKVVLCMTDAHVLIIWEILRYNYNLGLNFAYQL